MLCVCVPINVTFFPGVFVKERNQDSAAVRCICQGQTGSLVCFCWLFLADQSRQFMDHGMRRRCVQTRGGTPAATALTRTSDNSVSVLQRDSQRVTAANKKWQTIISAVSRVSCCRSAPPKRHNKQLPSITQTPRRDAHAGPWRPERRFVEEWPLARCWDLSNCLRVRASTSWDEKWPLHSPENGRDVQFIEFPPSVIRSCQNRCYTRAKC